MWRLVMEKEATCWEQMPSFQLSGLVRQYMWSRSECETSKGMAQPRDEDIGSEYQA